MWEQVEAAKVEARVVQCLSCKPYLNPVTPEMNVKPYSWTPAMRQLSCKAAKPLSTHSSGEPSAR